MPPFVFIIIRLNTFIHHSQSVSLRAEGGGSKGSVSVELVDCIKINCFPSTAQYIALY